MTTDNVQCVWRTGCSAPEQCRLERRCTRSNPEDREKDLELRPSKELARDLRILAGNFGEVTSQYIRDAADEIERLERELYLLRNERDNLADNVHRLTHEPRARLDADVSQDEAWRRLHPPSCYIHQGKPCDCHVGHAERRAAQPPSTRRRPTLEQSGSFTVAEERDWWRDYALAIEGAAHQPPGVTDRQRLEHYWKFCNVLTHPSYMDFQAWLNTLDEDRAARCPTATKESAP